MPDSNTKDSPQTQSFLKKLSCKHGWGVPDILHFRSSVFLTIIPILIISTIFTSIICAIYILCDIDITLPGSLVGTVSVVVGLLLAFRTNHAYNSYYEGRKLFCNLCTLARNSARFIWVSVAESSKKDRDEKKESIQLLLAFVIAAKHHLRLEFGIEHDDFEGLLPGDYQRTKFFGNAGQENIEPHCKSTEDPDNPDDLVNAQDPAPSVTVHNQEPTENTQLLQKSKNQHPVSYIKNTFRSLVGNNLNNAQDIDVTWGTEDPKMSLPMEIVFHLGMYYDKLAREKKADPYRLYATLDSLIDILGNLERISNTPIPAAYKIHLKQAVTLYVWVLPFTLVEILGWFTIPVIFVISFILFGVEAIGSEIEDPFGYDLNDLPLDEYCKDLEAEIKYLYRYLPTGQSDFHI